MPRRLSSRSRALPVALTIAGSDSGAGAGAQVDLLTFAALGVYGTTVITCLTAQNPDGVSAMHATPTEMVSAQLHQVIDYFPVRALKTGMLFHAPIIDAVAAFLRLQPRLDVVVDPVLVASSGTILLQPDAIDALRHGLFPLATIVTPNLDETGLLLGRRPENEHEAIDAARQLAARFRVPFLVKGGHLAGDQIVDILARPRGKPVLFRGPRIPRVDTHGSGCTLSAAITALLARGEKLDAAVAGARAFLRRGMTHPLRVAGRDFIAHAPSRRT